MAIVIREYTYPQDLDGFVSCMTALQDHVSECDPLHLQLPGQDIDQRLYCEQLLSIVTKQQGAIFVAVDDRLVVGCVVGILCGTDETYGLSTDSAQQGRVCELHVMESHRKRGVGQQLMKVIEAFLAKQGCSFIRVECFVPNSLAHDFYNKQGYSERCVDLIKRVDA